MDPIKENFQKIAVQAQADGVFAELLISGSEDLQLSVAEAKLEAFESSHNLSAGFRVIKGPAQGYAWTENLSEESLLRTYREALESTQYLKSDGEQVPLPVDAEAKSEFDNLCIDENIDIDDKIKAIQLLESASLKVDPRVAGVPYNSFSDSLVWTRLLNTNGLDKSFKQKYYMGFAYTLVKEGEAAKTGMEGFFVRKFSDADVAKTGRQAAQDALSHLGAKKLTTGHYPVVMDPSVGEQMIQALSEYFSAKSIFEKTSILQDKLGQSIASAKFNLVDDPLNKQRPGVRPFDAEGFNSKKTVLVEKGVAKNFLTNLEYAQKLKLPHTASAMRSPTASMGISASNLVVEKGQYSEQELLKRYPKMIHLTSISGGMHSGFNDTTGDFSLPGEGFLYENGQCVGPVDQFVFSGNILEMLKNVEDLGNTYEESYTPVLVPALLIKELSFAGA